MRMIPDIILASRVIVSPSRQLHWSCILLDELCQRSVAESSRRARASTSVIFAQSGATDTLLVPNLKMKNVPLMPSLADVVASLRLHWWVALIVPAVGIAATCLRALETDEARAKRAERNRK